MCISSCSDRYILAGLQPVEKADVIGRHRLGTYLSIREAYAAAVVQHGHENDHAQLRVVEALQKLQNQVRHGTALAGRIRRLLSGSTQPAARGIYLWGGVGRGKTYLMDLFFASL